MQNNQIMHNFCIELLLIWKINKRIRNVCRSLEYQNKKRSADDRQIFKITGYHLITLAAMELIMSHPKWYKIKVWKGAEDKEPLNAINAIKP